MSELQIHTYDEKGYCSSCAVSHRDELRVLRDQVRRLREVCERFVHGYSDEYQTVIEQLSESHVAEICLCSQVGGDDCAFCEARSLLAETAPVEAKA